jgi:hypothetical protein
MNRAVFNRMADSLLSYWQHLALVCRERRLVVPLWIVAFLTAWFALTLVYAGGIQARTKILYNSDLLMPFMVMRDVLHDPASIMQWELSPAIYAFPDWVLAGLLQASPLPRKVLPIAYGGFLLAVFGWSIGWILAEMRTVRRPEATLWGITLIAIVFLAGNVTRLGLGGNFLKWVCAPYIHSGSLFFGLVLIPLLSQVFHGESTRQPWPLIVATVVVVLGCYSDLTFAVWFAAPVCLAYLVMPTAMPFSLKLKTVAGLAVLGGTAAALDRLLRPSSDGLSDITPNVVRSFEVLQKLLQDSFAHGQWQLWLPAILSLVMLGRGAWLTYAQKNPTQAREDSIEVAIIFATLASVLLPVLMGVLIHPSLLRYSLPIVFLPYVWLLAYASRWCTPRQKLWISSSAVVFLLACVTFFAWGVASVNKIQNAKTMSGLLASLGQRAGYGDYWTCNRTMFETDYAVHCVQLNAEGKRLNYNYNTDWFERRADDGGEIRPTFVVTTGLDETVVRSLFGEPDTIEQFPGEKEVENIWLYDKPLPLISSTGALSPKQTIFTKGNFVGVGTENPEATLHVSRQNHPDLLKLQNISEGGASWLMQIGGNGWQDGHLMFSHRPSGKYSLVMEPTGKVVVMGDMHVAGKLTTAQPSNATSRDTATATAATAAELKKEVDALTALVKELLGRVSDLEKDLEDAAVPSP